MEMPKKPFLVMKCHMMTFELRDHNSPGATKWLFLGLSWRITNEIVINY